MITIDIQLKQSEKKNHDIHYITYNAVSEDWLSPNPWWSWQNRKIINLKIPVHKISKSSSVHVHTANNRQSSTFESSEETNSKSILKSHFALSFWWQKEFTQNLEQIRILSCCYMYIFPAGRSYLMLCDLKI